MPSSDRGASADALDRDITSIALHARDCLRTVWNTYYRTLDDAEHWFSQCEDLLLTDLLYSQVAEDVVLTSERGFAYHSGISIFAIPGSEKTEVLLAEKRSESWQWARRIICLGDLDLRFGNFFDFVTFDEKYRDFEFVESVIVGARTDAYLLGDRLLIPALNVLYVAT